LLIFFEITAASQFISFAEFQKCLIFDQPILKLLVCSLFTFILQSLVSQIFSFVHVLIYILLLYLFQP